MLFALSLDAAPGDAAHDILARKEEQDDDRQDDDRRGRHQQLGIRSRLGREDLKTPRQRAVLVTGDNVHGPHE